jgi:hypothetical protein
MLLQLRGYAAFWKRQIEEAPTPQQKTEYEQQLNVVEAEIKEYLESGVKERREKERAA